MRWPYGLYGHGMHDQVMRELEVGARVAVAEDDEACGVGPLLDYAYEEYMRNAELRADIDARYDQVEDVPGGD